VTLGVLSEQGGSLGNLRASGQETRFTDQYLARYARAFDRVFYFSYADETAPPGAAWVLVPNRRAWHRWIYAGLLPFLHARQFRECDVLRVMQLTGEVPAMIARFLYGVPFVATYGYDYSRNAGAEGAGALRQGLFRLRTAAALRAAAGIIVTNAATADVVARRIPRDRIIFVPNGVDLSRFTPRPADRPVHDPLRILFVGRLSPEKNLDLLVEAVAGSSRRAVLRLVGDGPERDRVRAEAQARGVAVEFAGVVPHESLREQFDWCDLFVLPSKFEGHPKSLIEAMASGCVCVGTRVPGIDGILADGETGLLAVPAADDLRRAIDRAAGDTALRTRLSQAAAAHAAAHFDIERLLAHEIEALRAIAARRARRAAAC
jgi:glycosyltransferase involved in cell wall biosynthesis